jgi:hypothetical protein
MERELRKLRLWVALLLAGLLLVGLIIACLHRPAGSTASSASSGEVGAHAR